MCLVKGKWKPNEFKADIKHFAQQTKLKVSAVSQFPQPGFQMPSSELIHWSSQRKRDIQYYLNSPRFAFLLANEFLLNLGTGCKNHEVMGRRLGQPIHGKLLKLSKWKTTDMSVDIGLPSKQNDDSQMPNLLNAQILLCHQFWYFPQASICIPSWPGSSSPISMGETYSWV